MAATALNRTWRASVEIAIDWKQQTAIALLFGWILEFQSNANRNGSC